MDINLDGLTLEDEGMTLHCLEAGEGCHYYTYNWKQLSVSIRSQK